MEWTTRFFYYKSNEWGGWIAGVDLPSAGQRAYADKQMAMWQNIGEEAYRQFLRASPNMRCSLAECQGLGWGI